MRIDQRGRVRERRRKRLVLPIVYFMAELIVVSLVLILLEMSYDFRVWSQWSYIAFGVVFAYGLIKTLHVYNRQKDL